jgi:probable HAF family extracellular repeat protein
MKSRLFCSLFAVVLFAAVVLGHEDHIRYTISAIDTLGGAQNFAYAINNRGDVVGLSRTAGDASNESFLFSSGRVRSLSPLNSGDLQTVGPTGINEKGLIASGVIQDGVYMPALYDSRTGRITTLGSLGGVTAFGFSGVATAINDEGQAVGYSYLDDVNHHAFVYSDGLIMDLGSLGGDSAALDINDSGEVVGFHRTRSAALRTHSCTAMAS